MQLPDIAAHFFTYHQKGALEILLQDDSIYQMLKYAVPEFADFSSSNEGESRAVEFESFCMDAEQRGLPLYDELCQAADEISQYQPLLDSSSLGFQVQNLPFERSYCQSVERCPSASNLSILSTETLQPRPSSRSRRSVSVNVQRLRECDLDRVGADMRSLRLRNDLDGLKRQISDARSRLRANAREIRSLQEQVLRVSKGTSKPVLRTADAEIDNYRRKTTALLSQIENARSAIIEAISMAKRDGVSVASLPDRYTTDLRNTAAFSEVSSHGMWQDSKYSRNMCDELLCSIEELVFALISRNEVQCAEAARGSKINVTETSIIEGPEERRVRVENQALRFRIECVQDRLRRVIDIQ